MNDSGSTQKVGYAKQATALLMLPVPLDRRINEGATDAEGKPARPIVPLQACLEQFAATHSVDDWLSPATNSRTQALRRTRIESFPPYLIVSINKFTVGENWQVKVYF